eukprot:COSAG05_NODE_807_length_7192_cov_92.394191_10_plen_87_part_00
MSKLNDERWAFKVEHYDPAADLVRQYELLYYLGDSTLEMVRRRKQLQQTNPLQQILILSQIAPPLATPGRAARSAAAAHPTRGGIG